MPRNPAKGKSSRHVLINDDDWALLDEMFGQRSTKRIGVGNVVCAIIAQRCAELRAKLEKRANQPKVGEEG